MITKRPKRLAGVSYVGLQRYFLTICTNFRQPSFECGATASAVLMQLRQTSALFEFAIVAYCFMPDHLHVLLSGTSDGADFRAFVKRFKQLTGFAHKRIHGTELWQPGYHEHILRDDEVTKSVARYILENPARGGLTKEIGEYALAGSDVYEPQALLSAWDRRT